MTKTLLTVALMAIGIVACGSPNTGSPSVSEVRLVQPTADAASPSIENDIDSVSETEMRAMLAELQTKPVAGPAYEVQIARLAGEWAWSPKMSTDNPQPEFMQKGCNDPNSTALPNEFSKHCFEATGETYLRGWHLNLLMRSNVGVVLACLRIERAIGGNELLGCAICGSSEGGCATTVGQDFGDGARTLQAGDKIGFRIDGYGTPCTGVASIEWAPVRYCEYPVEVQAGMVFGPIAQAR